MKRATALLLLGLAGAAMLLQGCVAAAVPMLAGGAIFNREISDADENSSQPAPVIQSRQALAAAPDEPTQPALIAVENDSFLTFANYAMTKAIAPADTDPRLSAVLRNPGLLDGERRACRDQPLGVLIDLDPGQSLVELGNAPQLDPRKANLLDSLRNQGVEIGWVSGRPAAEAGEIRAMLVEAGLDRSSKDRLLLMRYAEDRKQTRRAEFAREHCVIALAGDEPTDFDELYDFIIDPSGAAALDPLYGDGWFMIAPLLPQE